MHHVMTVSTGNGTLVFKGDVNALRRWIAATWSNA